MASGIFWYFVNSFSYYEKRIDYSKQITDYKETEAALAWLEEQEREPVAVMANYKNELNKYITTLTKHYVLFSDSGVLHLLSGKEAEERYLLNGVMNNLSLKDIENDYRLFAGNGNAVHPYKTHNRKVKIIYLLLFLF